MADTSVRRVEVRISGLGGECQPVQEWLTRSYAHTEPMCWDDERGRLVVTLLVPVEAYDALGSWTARMLEATASLDLVLEILASCFEDLELPPAQISAIRLDPLGKG